MKKITYIILCIILVIPFSIIKGQDRDTLIIPFATEMQEPAYTPLPIEYLPQAEFLLNFDYQNLIISSALAHGIQIGLDEIKYIKLYDQPIIIGNILNPDRGTFGNLSELGSTGKLFVPMQTLITQLENERNKVMASIILMDSIRYRDGIETDVAENLFFCPNINGVESRGVIKITRNFTEANVQEFSDKILYVILGRYGLNSEEVVEGSGVPDYPPVSWMCREPTIADVIKENGDTIATSNRYFYYHQPWVQAYRDLKGTPVSESNLPLVYTGALYMGDLTIPAPPDDDMDQYPAAPFGTDCDDSDPDINPSVNEIPNNDIDENCDGIFFMIDQDGDGFNSSEDCDDQEPEINPDAIEICNDIDDNCDGVIDEGFDKERYFRDFDGDGFGNGLNSITTCLDIPNGFVRDSTDCDDFKFFINPDMTEVPNNGIDDNCNGEIDETETTYTYYLDNDNDGYGDGNQTISTTLSTPPTGYVTNNTDCDDTNNTVFPNAPELCDEIDNDCNALIDEGLTVFTYYADTDVDGFGDGVISVNTCSTTPPAGYVIDNTDCDDNNADINPDAVETPYNGLDDDCDETTLDDDLDQDGFILAEDCDDNNADINPDTNETPYNGIDDDCNPNTLDDDLDQDGFILAEDCDDNDPLVFPGAEEICDDIDNDCDGAIDNNIQSITYYIDVDNDGFGEAEMSIVNCSQPQGYVENSLDCDDTDAAINPDAIEVPNNGIDEDCDGEDLITSASQVIEELGIKAYPNPTSGLIMLESPAGIEITIYDPQGIAVQILDSSSTQNIDLSEYPSGLYILQVIHENRVGLLKLVKQ